MRKIYLFTLVALFSTFIFSCNKEKSATDTTPEPPVVTNDSDATKFIQIAQIADTSQKQAIQSLVKQLKDSALWSKFMAIYPFVGGTENSTKINLKDPRDMDEAFRITFHGNPVIGATGVLFPTTADYADTHFYDSLLTFNDNSISYFSRTQNTVSGYDMGCNDWIAPYNEMTIYNETNASDYFGFNIFGNKPANTKGLFMFSATTTNVTWFENGVQKLEKGSVPVNKFTAAPILIGWCQNADAGGQRECAFSTIGKGFSATEALTLNNIVTNFEAALKR